ncbi:hypothetical protein ARMSODRAFT_1085605 [Armillaria solidipes]|uniref:Uncharacterized protein n=1 Tax=Armillaria solidipes TaxID=1076256 RepID=A0A2H3BAK0_9AGAR|nr:hypothetical protein ARMSODRAFT_1085605 [Armillaria solidipes]
MSVPRTMAEELAPVIGQIEALDTFLKCEKEEEAAVLADEERLERELYAYSMASEALLVLFLPEFIPHDYSKKPAPLTVLSEESTTGIFKHVFSRKRKVHEDEPSSREASTSNKKHIAPKQQPSKVGRGKSLRGKEVRA